VVLKKNMGVRPMARVIKEKIKKPLAEEMMFGELEKGGNVELTIRELK
jgi:ATP-dependent Clp protease ATP-binding subunit ClpA